MTYNMTWQHDFTLSQHNSCDLHLNNKFLSWMISNKLLSQLISNKFLSQSISSKLLSQLISNKSFNQSISYFSTLSAWISNLFSSSTSVKFKKFSQLNNCIDKNERGWTISRQRPIEAYDIPNRSASYRAQSDDQNKPLFDSITSKMTASQVKNRKSKFFAPTQAKIGGETRVHQRRRKNHQVRQ